MWNPYQYRQGKLKLIKDIKTGQPHLRVSLIDHQQINDLTKIYESRKDYYRIDATVAVLPSPVEEKYQQQAISNLSYKEKIQLYRKRLHEEKLQNKYSNLFKKIQKKKSSMRNPILHKILQHFQETLKHEEETNIKDDIKESEKNLEMIKINSNRRAFFSQNSPSNNMTRPRFISLQNSLPEKQYKEFPKWVDYASGMYLKPDNNNKGINIASLQNNLDNLIQKKSSQPQMIHNHSFSHNKEPHVYREKTMTDHKLSSHLAHFQHVNAKEKHREHLKDIDREQNFILNDDEKKREIKTADVYERHKQHKQHEKLDKSPFNRTTKSKTTQSKRFFRSKPNENINHAIRTFSKSQHYSKEVIDTMSNFYKAKATKKEDYQKMVYFLKNDRPFTSEIRRKNYKIIGQQSLKNVKQYRNISEKERKKIREENFRFYLQLLKKMQPFNIEQLPLSGKIIQKIRILLQSSYYIEHSHYQQISEPSLYEERDPMSQQLLSSVERLVTRHAKENHH